MPAPCTKPPSGGTVLSNLLTGTLVNGTNSSAPAVAGAALAAPVLCDCDCHDATSPLAYLADLLDYAIKHLRSVIFADGLRGEYFTDRRSVQSSSSASTRTSTSTGGPGHPGRTPRGRLLGPLDRDGLAPRNRKRHVPHRQRRRRPERQPLGRRSAAGRQQQLLVGWDGRRARRAERIDLLRGGRRSDVRLEYVETNGGARVQLLWSSDSLSSRSFRRVHSPLAHAPSRSRCRSSRTATTRPFRGLSERCEYMEKPIRQVRIAAEVLARHPAGGSRRHGAPICGGRLPVPTRADRHVLRRASRRRRRHRPAPPARAGEPARHPREQRCDRQRPPRRPSPRRRQSGGHDRSRARGALRLSLDEAAAARPRRRGCAREVASGRARPTVARRRLAGGRARRRPVRSSIRM